MSGRRASPRQSTSCDASRSESETNASSSCATSSTTTASRVRECLNLKIHSVELVSRFDCFRKTTTRDGEAHASVEPGGGSVRATQVLFRRLARSHMARIPQIAQVRRDLPAIRNAFKFPGKFRCVSVDVQLETPERPQPPTCPHARHVTSTCYTTLLHQRSLLRSCVSLR